MQTSVTPPISWMMILMKIARRDYGDTPGGMQ